MNQIVLGGLVRVAISRWGFLVERALDKNDQRLLRITSKRVGGRLRTQKENGLVRCEQGPGWYMLWQIDS